ncbi:MAG: hypothetical protein AB7E52_00960 [Bdellovibrionales bacterium]
MVDPTNSSATPVRSLAPAPDTMPSSSQQEAPQTADSATSAKTAPRQAKAAKTRKPPKNFSTTPFWMGMLLSILWVGVVAFVMSQSGTGQTFAGVPLANWAIGISAIISPVAMIWMVAAYLQRAADVQSVTEPLRRQLAMITGESGIAEVRIRRFNHAIKEQLELLRSTKTIGDDELMAIMDRINEHKSEMENFEQQSLYQVNEVQDVIRRSMQHIEQLMEDKFAMLRILDNKLVQSGDDVARQTESIRENISTLLQEVETTAVQVATAVEQAMHNSKKLSDTARSQETSLISAAETASTTLSELSGKIDSNIAHFLSRSGMAREEAEKLASALDSQTRSLDEFSNLLPARISEAESVLRGVADRLYASEQLAREQATHLTERLESQVENMQALLDRFASRVKEIDGGLEQRRSDLDGLVVRISGASDDLAQKLDGTIVTLGTRADGVLEKFASANEEARKGTDAIATQLSETAARYEAATRHLGTVSEANSTQLRAATHEINEQLTKFNALQQATQQAGQEVQTRAATALQNLQQVLERLLATRDATQTVGDTLTEKLRSAVDQNERVITRINEAARMTVHALGIATESLGRQENDITAQAQTASTTLNDTISLLQTQAHSAEESMRSQNDALTIMLQDIRERLDSTDKRLQDFADYATAPVQQVVDQINQSTDDGRETLNRYSNDMQSQLDRLQGFNSSISSMGQEVGRMTSETLTAIEDMNKRFQAIREAQDETSRKAIEQFNAVADRLHGEVGTLGDKASEAASTLQQAAVQVGQQTYQLQSEAKDSEAKINIVTTALQNEAAAIRSTLEQQAQEINNELTRAGSRFKEMGEELKERTDNAYAMLDRVAAHYNEMTHAAAQDIENRASKLDMTASEATGKVQSLSAAMESQLSMINEGTGKIDNSAGKLTATSAQTIDQLERLHARFSITQADAVEGSDHIVARMEEALEKFKTHHDSLNEAAESSVSSIQKAGTAFGEQASRMLDTSHQVEDSIRSLNTATTTFADQSSQIRTAMEQHNSRLIGSLKESLEQIDTTSESLQKTAAAAILGADQATARYNSMAETASSRLENTSQDLFKIADKAESTLGDLSAGITKQVAALNLVGEQIAEQHRTLSASNETQRTQLLDLFDKLGTAHTDASQVAERTIERLGDVLDRVQTHLGLLSDNSTSALDNIAAASNGFSEKADMLLSHAKQAEEQARSAITVTGSLQDQAKQLRDALQEETRRTGDMLTDLLGRLTSGSGDMKDVSSTASMALTDLQMGVAKQVGSLNEAMDKIAARQDTLTNALESQRETLSGLISRLTMAQDETASAAERAANRLSEGTVQISHQIETLDSKAAATLTSIHAASDSFAKETAALIANTDEAEAHTKKLLESATTMQRDASEVCDKLRSETQATGQTISAVVSQLEGNVDSLRETSLSTETALTNLSSTISQQTTAINGNLNSISEKQTSLGSALDVQREMLGSMVTRLTLAQDETAAAAERSAARISDSTGQITRQMETLDTQTQSALAAVRAVSSGLSDEAVTIGEHTQKAEAQVRDMLQSTSGMHEQAKNLRESINGESDKMLDQIRTVMTQLDATVSQMKSQSGNIMNMMDKSALDFSSISNNASETLQKQAENLGAIAGQSESNISGVNEKIREGIKLISDASDMSETHGRRLMETAEKATTQLVSLISTMTESDRESRVIVEKATTRLTETRTTLEKELQTIADLSARAVEQVMGAGSALAIQSDALRANLASSESALVQAADTVREETVQLPNLLGRSTKEIENASKMFKTQTGEISDSMLKTTDRCIATTGAIRDTLMDEARHLSSVAETANNTLTQFNDALKAQLEAIKTGTTTLSAEQKELVEKASQTITQLSAASDRLGQLRGDTQQTSSKLAHEFEVIEARATATTQRLSAAGDNLSKQVAALVAMTEKADSQMQGASQSFRDQVERVRSGVQTQIDDINRGLMQITAQLDRTGASLRTAMAGTVVDVEKIATRFDQTSKETANQLTDRTARMRVATEEVAKLLGGFGDQIDALLNRLGSAGEGIKRHESDLVGHMQQAFSHLGAVAERLNSTRVLTENVSEAAVTKLSEVAQQVDKQMRHMAEGGQTVTGIIQNVSQTYADQVSRVNGSVVESQEQIVAMNKSIEEMQQRTDRMRVTLKLQGDDLMGSLEEILRQLSGAGDAMSTAVDGSLQRKAIDSLKKIS